MSSTSAHPRPQRADARRNRERVLAAAKEAFEAEGISVPLDEIARRAGVGAGTVHRHFPTKESLLEAIVVGNMQALTEHAWSLLSIAKAGTAFFDFFALMVERGASNRALTAALAQAGTDVQTVAQQPGSELLEAVAALLARAQQAGTVRADVTAQHVKALLIGVYAGSDWLGGTARDRRRLVDVIIDGLRR
jgi:AcrR family transcriptional regulator